MVPAYSTSFYVPTLHAEFIGHKSLRVLAKHKFDLRIDTYGKAKYIRLITTWCMAGSEVVMANDINIQITRECHEHKSFHMHSATSSSIIMSASQPLLVFWFDELDASMQRNMTGTRPSGHRSRLRFNSILHMDDLRFDWHKGYQSFSPSDLNYWWSRSSYDDQKFDKACPTKKYNMHWSKIITISVRAKKIVMTIRQNYLKTTLTFLSQGNTRVLLKLAETSNLSMYSLGFHKGNQSKLTYTVDIQQRGGSIIYDEHRSFILRCRKSKDHLLLFSVADIDLCCMLYYCMI